MLSLRSSAKNDIGFSFTSRIFIIFTFIFTSFCFIFCFSYLYFYYKLQKYERKIIRQNISLILSTHEQFRLSSKFNTIANTIWHLDTVDGVILFDKQCNVIKSIPLNINTNNKCSINLTKPNWLQYDFSDPYSELYLISVKTKLNFWKQALISILPVAIVSIALAFLSIFLALWFIRKYLTKPLQQIANSIIDLTLKDSSVLSYDNEKYPRELRPIVTALFNTEQELIETKRRIIEQAEDETRKTIHEKVVHNIDSPLNIINNYSKHFDTLSDKKKKLFGYSLNRLKEIVKCLKDNKVLDISKIKKCNLLELLNSIISEKEFEYEHLEYIHIISEYSDFENTPYVNIDPIEFKSIISNLINNSIDALNGTLDGEIHISIKHTDNKQVIISIRDNGSGISSDILPELFKKGATFNKNKGSGEGLYHAKTNIESWNGSIDIISNSGQFTELIISMPITSYESLDHNLFKITEKYCLEETNYFLIDDDEICRFNWEISSQENDINFKAFCSYKDFLKIIAQINKNSNIYLDSELEDDKKGEEVAKQLYEQGYKNLYLSTSHSPSRFKEMYWIKGIIDKVPPWITINVQ